MNIKNNTLIPPHKKTNNFYRLLCSLVCMLLVCLVLLTSCNNTSDPGVVDIDSGDDTTAEPVASETKQTAKNTEPLIPETTWLIPETTASSSKIIDEGFDKLVAKAIPFPADGEKIVYDPAFVIIQNDSKGHVLAFTSAERNGNTVTFYAPANEGYYIHCVACTFLTHDDELFIGLNAQKQNDGTIKYVVQKYDRIVEGDHTYDKIDNMKQGYGKEFDSSHGLFQVSIYFLDE